MISNYLTIADEWNFITDNMDDTICSEGIAMGVFTVELSAFETLCAAAADDGCTFVKDNYVPYGLGILRAGETYNPDACANGPRIVIPNTPWSFYSEWETDDFTQYSSVSWDDNGVF